MRRLTEYQKRTVIRVPRGDGQLGPRAAWLKHLVDTGAVELDRHGKRGLLTRDVIDPDTGDLIRAEGDRAAWIRGEAEEASRYAARHPREAFRDWLRVHLFGPD